LAPDQLPEIAEQLGITLLELQAALDSPSSLARLQVPNLKQVRH